MRLSLLFACAFGCVALVAAGSGVGAQATGAVQIELTTAEDVTLAAGLDEDISTLAVIVGGCVQAGGSPRACLCAAQPALGSLVSLVERTLAARPHWGAAGAVVMWRSGELTRAISVPGALREATLSLAQCQN